MMSNFKKLFVSLFIALNILSMIRIHLPLNKPFWSRVYRPIDSYLSFFSIFQSWTMFAPNPARISSYVTAEIEFNDGSKDSYTFPRTIDLTWGDKYIYGERFRVLTETVRRDDGSFLWRDVAKYALRQLKEKNFHKVPLKVRLVRHWQETPDIKKRFIPHVTANNVFKSHNFYTHEVL